MHVPLALDMTAADWTRQLTPGFDRLVAVNRLHIAPWQGTGGCSMALRGCFSDGLLAIYGCFRHAGVQLSAGNADFDRSRCHRDARWRVRDTDDVVAADGERGLALAEVASMPANNLLRVLHPSSPDTPGDRARSLCARDVVSRTQFTPLISRAK